MLEFRKTHQFFMGCTNYKHDGKGCNHIEQIEDFKKDNN